MERMECGLRELKFASSGGSMTFTGYGAVFGNIDAYGDVIAPGAFADTLADTRKSGNWPALLLQHGGGFLGGSAEDMTPIGVITDLSEDGHGLKMDAKLADTARGRDAYTLMKMEPRPAINGLSIGYIAKESVPRSKPEEPRRTLKRIDLIEVSLVTFPANGKARVGSVKSINEIEDLSGIESFLREVGGISRSEAKALCSRMLGLARREVANPDDSAALLASLKRRADLLLAA